jgi:hypothetical protein
VWPAYVTRASAIDTPPLTSATAHMPTFAAAARRRAGMSRDDSASRGVLGVWICCAGPAAARRLPFARARFDRLICTTRLRPPDENQMKAALARSSTGRCPGPHRRNGKAHPITPLPAEPAQPWAVRGRSPPESPAATAEPGGWIYPIPKSRSHHNRAGNVIDVHATVTELSPTCHVRQEVSRATRGQR